MAAAALLLLFPASSHAATITWSGLGGTSNWSEGANWIGGIPPGPTDVATFDATSTKDSVVDSPVAGDTIQAGYQLNPGLGTPPGSYSTEVTYSVTASP